MMRQREGIAIAALHQLGLGVASSRNWNGVNRHVQLRGVGCGDIPGNFQVVRKIVGACLQATRRVVGPRAFNVVFKQAPPVGITKIEKRAPTAEAGRALANTHQN